MRQPRTEARSEFRKTPLGLFGQLTTTLLLAGLSGCVTPSTFGGPLAVRNQHPAQLTVLRLEPASARTVGEGQSRVDLSLSYSSLFLRGTSATDTFVMDGEILRTQLGARYGLTDALQIEFAIPVAHTSGGFLDHTVKQWHDAIDTPESGRGTVPDNDFRIAATRNGETVYSMDETALALMDVPIGLTWQLQRATEADPLGFAVRGAIELPTGDANDGFGNGGLDVSLGVVGEVLLGSLALTAHLEHTFASTPSRAKRAGVEFGDVTSGGIGIEAALTRDTVALVQVEADQSVLHELRYVHTDDTQFMLWVGLRSRLGDRLSVELGFGEDLSRDGPPDFTAFVGFRLDVGPKD